MNREADKRRSYEWGILWMLISASFLSISFLFLKLNLAYLDFFTVIFLRFSIPLCFVLVFLTALGQWKAVFKKPKLWLQVLRSLCVLVSQYGLAFYLSHDTLLNATILLNTSPLFIPFIEWLFLGRVPGKSTIVGATVAFFGVILVLKPDVSLFSVLSGIGLLAALGQASSQVLYGLQSKRENLLVSLFYLFFFTTLVSGLIDLAIHNKVPEQLVPEKMTYVAILVLLMAIGTLFNQFFRGLAYRCGNPSTLTTFLYFSVFVSALLDALVFQHYPAFSTVIGGCLIILGGVLKIFLRAHILKHKVKK